MKRMRVGSESAGRLRLPPPCKTMEIEEVQDLKMKKAFESR